MGNKIYQVEWHLSGGGGWIVNSELGAMTRVCTFGCIALVLGVWIVLLLID